MITFEVLTEEEKFSRALGAIYTLLLKLADEKKNAPKPDLVDLDVHQRTLTTEYPPEV